MTHTVLARKWRPKLFSDLVGQQSSVTILQNIITSQRLHHAYLLTGTRGVGKTTIARIIAKALNCLSPNGCEPCGECSNCQQIDRGRMVDVIEIDAASNTGVDNIREVIENAQYAPTSGKYKIYIIDEVHMLSKSAFNAMLKTLEEPPAHIVFILATTDPQKLPITILSRCLQLKLRNLASGEIANHVQKILTYEQLGFETDALDLIAKAANGSMRDALSLTDQAIAFATHQIISLDKVQQMLGISDNQYILNLITTIIQSNSAELVNLCQLLNQQGHNFENLLEQINDQLFQIALLQMSPAPANTNSQLLNLAQQIPLQECQLYFEISNLGLEQIRKTTSQYPIFVMTLLRMICFRIGTNPEKQKVIYNSNCNLPLNKSETEITTTTEQPVTTSTIETETILNTQQPSVNVPETTSQEPDNDDLPPWIAEPEIDNSTTPLIESNSNEKLEAPSQLANTSQGFNSWLEFVSLFDLDSLEPSLGAVLKHTWQESYIRAKTANDHAELHLALPESFQQWVTPNLIDKIESLLFEHYEQEITPEFNFIPTQEVHPDSLKAKQNQQQAQLQQQAEHSINNDPTIQDMLMNYQATLSQIKPYQS
ncbi:MAG: hypothetical protein RLZZ293_848 [Pseudomonadota bacterium]|jgi:DNA polymerase-3 subunit gamma/tau